MLPPLLDERSKELLREFGRINGERTCGLQPGRRRQQRATRQSRRSAMVTKRSGKAYYMISAVAQKYNIHPQTLRLYEREGLLKPSRTEGNTRLYSEEDLEQLETILSLTRDLGVNLAGVEIILNMRRKMAADAGRGQRVHGVRQAELARGIDDWEQRLSTALVKSSPTDLVRTRRPPLRPAGWRACRTGACRASGATLTRSPSASRRRAVGSCRGHARPPTSYRRATRD